MREKLIELLFGAEFESEQMCANQPDCDSCPRLKTGCQASVVADYLIANGVTVPVGEIEPDYEAEDV